MSRQFFGTDGVRGIANVKLTPELAFQLGQAAGLWVKSRASGSRVAIGADTRRSSPMLAAAVAAGVCSTGLDVLDIGVAPTPAVSYTVRKGDYCLGVIISASHNPAPDNGIKFVGNDGRKLSDQAEEEIEALMTSEFVRPSGQDVGSIEYGREPIEGYIQHLVGLLPEGLEGWTVAMDCAQGAAWEIGPELIRRLGGQLILTGVEPNGMNINAEGGATKPETVCEVTQYNNCTIGVAFDGDADRAVFCDEKGRLINGDRTMGIWASHQQAQGKLNPPVVVGTVMSNGGFEQFLGHNGIGLVRAPVGDKYVAEHILSTGALVGGEQSGHIIFPEQGPTGDGLGTMIALFRVLRQGGNSASHYYNSYEPWPQLLVNVGVESSLGWKEKLERELRQAESMLEGKGRVVVRPSGTQPMLRVMVEASNYESRDEVAQLLTDALEAKMNGQILGRVDLTHALGD